jgi:hypothetical protein
VVRAKAEFDWQAKEDARQRAAIAHDIKEQRMVQEEEWRMVRSEGKRHNRKRTRRATMAAVRIPAVWEGVVAGCGWDSPTKSGERGPSIGYQ